MLKAFAIFMLLLLIGIVATIGAFLATGSLLAGQLLGIAAILGTGFWLDRRYDGSSNSQSR